MRPFEREREIQAVAFGRGSGYDIGYSLAGLGDEEVDLASLVWAPGLKGEEDQPSSPQHI